MHIPKLRCSHGDHSWFAVAMPDSGAGFDAGAYLCTMSPEGSIDGALWEGAGQVGVQLVGIVFITMWTGAITTTVGLQVEQHIK